jgi:hypothetical protein
MGLSATIMSAENFPEDLLLHDPERRARLISEFYQQYGESRPDGYYSWGCQHEEAKSAFYRINLEANGHDQRSLGVDVGCQGGVLINFVNVVSWVGVDIDQLALEEARKAAFRGADTRPPHFISRARSPSEFLFRESGIPPAERNGRASSEIEAAVQSLCPRHRLGGVITEAKCRTVGSGGERLDLTRRLYSARKAMAGSTLVARRAGM